MSDLQQNKTQYTRLVYDYDDSLESFWSLHRDTTSFNATISTTPGAHPEYPVIGGSTESVDRTNKMWVKDQSRVARLRLWGAAGETDISNSTVDFDIYVWPRQGTGMKIADLQGRLSKTGGSPTSVDMHPVKEEAIANTDFYELAFIAATTSRIDSDVIKYRGDTDDVNPMWIQIDVSGFHAVYVEPTAASSATRVVIEIARME